MPHPMFLMLRPQLTELGFHSFRKLATLGWLLIAAGHGSAWAVDASGEQIICYPPTIYVSRAYPAQVVVVAIASDGTMRDLTRAPGTKFSCPTSPAALQYVEGKLQLTELAASNEPQTQLHTATLTAGEDSIEVSMVIDRSTSNTPIFSREISSVLGKSGCNQGTCHGNLHGKGGFRLSLRGDDPFFDFDSVARHDGARRVDMFAAELSLLLKKPSGSLAHQGGLRLPTDSIEYQWIKDWIADGCHWNASTSFPPPSLMLQPSEQLIELSVFPTNSLLAGDCRQQQLVVTARFGDGILRDVTRWAKFEASSPTGVSIGAEGLVQAERAIDIGVSVSYLSGRSAARLTFLPDNASPDKAATQSWSESSPPTRLDEIVERQLKRLRLEPSPLADESTFLRRSYLSVVGRLPSVDETRQYLASSSEDKQSRLIEKLLRDPGYAKLWALHWSDLLRNEQKVMSPRGTTQWHAWMVDQVDRDVPLTSFVTSLLTNIGSTYENPPASFHRTHREPETAAETVGQVFLGVRLQCARCHNHPFDSWRQDDYYGLAAYFSTLRREQIDNKPKDTNDKHIITGDEIITLSSEQPEIWHPGLARNVPPKPLTVSYPANADPQTPDTSRERDGSLSGLALWLTQDNRLFARNMANRIWFHVMGRGIVDPPDDFRDSNPPSHPELLEYLTDELIRSDFSTRQLTRLILSSRCFARAAVEDVVSSQSTAGQETLDAAAMFAGYPLRRMPAEILYDAISDATQVFAFSESDQSRASEVRFVDQAEVPERAGFMTAFGKPTRLLVCECERSSAVSLGQSLVLVNGQDVRDKLADPLNRLTQLTESNSSLSDTVNELYLATLTRPPTSQEQTTMRDYLQSQSDQRLALEDILWALVNSKEFSLIR